ncbi:hypothetical protein GCM10025868_29870 [Angustibacter aerolatus]|uniref:Uncharacterized protein n=1 Tax=Angustibacter aerolatus TaxID=1162965 RepID=A0ABQ6JLL2_9ACTN|nr:hypothetical protein GCM10025868_29870 [Angustibacter aerolatus]
MRSVVPNAFCTAATVPLAVTKARFDGTSPMLSPAPFRNDSARWTAAVEGAYAARTCAGVR